MTDIDNEIEEMENRHNIPDFRIEILNRFDNLLDSWGQLFQLQLFYSLKPRVRSGANPRSNTPNLSLKSKHHIEISIFKNCFSILTLSKTDHGSDQVPTPG